MHRIPIASRVAAATLLPLLASNALAQLSSGVASGEITPGSALLWTRSESLGSVRFEVSTDASFDAIVSSVEVQATDVALPVKVTVSGLEDGTRYHYRASDASDLGLLLLNLGPCGG